MYTSFISKHLLKARAKSLVDFYNAGREPGPFTLHKSDRGLKRWVVFYTRPNNE